MTGDEDRPVKPRERPSYVIGDGCLAVILLGAFVLVVLISLAAEGRLG